MRGGGLLRRRTPAALACRQRSDPGLRGPAGARPPRQTYPLRPTSNLTLSPPDLADWVTHYDITVLCGVDGPPEIHDRCRTYPGGGPSHARTAATIGRLVQAGARVTLRTTITSANHDCLDRVAAHHAGLGAAASLFVPVRPVNSDRDFFPEAILPDPDKIIAAARQLGRRGETGKANLFPFNDFSGEIRPGVRHEVACGAPAGATYVVRVNGDVYPCIYLVGQEQYRLGNVTGRLDRRPLDDMLQALHVDHREGCRACAWRYACGGGCPVMNLARLRGAESRPRVVEYSRRITCDLSRALLADSLWGLADRPGMPDPHRGKVRPMPVRFPVAGPNVAAIKVHRCPGNCAWQGDKESPYEGYVFKYPALSSLCAALSLERGLIRGGGGGPK